MACPKECEDDRTKIKADILALWKRSIPQWVRGIMLAVIGMAIGVAYTNNGSIKEIKAHQSHIREALKDLALSQREMKSELKKDFGDRMNRFEKILLPQIGKLLDKEKDYESKRNGKSGNTDNSCSINDSYYSRSSVWAK